MNSDVAKRLVRQGWTRTNWRRIDGGSDYYQEPPTAAPVTRLRDVRPAAEDRAVGHADLAWAVSLVRQGYSPERVRERTGWGLWWLPVV